MSDMIICVLISIYGAYDCNDMTSKGTIADPQKIK